MLESIPACLIMITAQRRWTTRSMSTVGSLLQFLVSEDSYFPEHIYLWIHNIFEWFSCEISSNNQKHPTLATHGRTMNFWWTRQRSFPAWCLGSLRWRSTGFGIITAWMMTVGVMAMLQMFLLFLVISDACRCKIGDGGWAGDEVGGACAFVFWPICNQIERCFSLEVKKHLWTVFLPVWWWGQKKQLQNIKPCPISSKYHHWQP